MGFELNFNLFTTEMPITVCGNPHPLYCLLYHQLNGCSQLLVPNLCRGGGEGRGRDLQNQTQMSMIQTKRQQKNAKKKKKNNQGQGCKVDLEISINSLYHNPSK